VAERKQAEVVPEQQPHKLCVGLLQTAPRFGRVDDNLAGVAEMLHDVAGVDLALTPELAATGYGFATPGEASLLVADDPRLVEVTTGPTAVGIGFAERSNADLPWNSYLLADPSTGLAHVQRKIHPVSYAPWNEHETFAPGSGLGVVDVRGARTAAVVCNDMWHPVVPWLAAHLGAEVVIVPVASIAGPDVQRVRHTWQLILEHAALLLQCYVVFINRCGKDGGAQFWGGSCVVGPDGEVLTRLGEAPGTAVTELDLSALRRLRADVPLRAESRADFVVEALATAPEGPHRV
jgi:predicted amidohydrolase